MNYFQVSCIYLCPFSPQYFTPYFITQYNYYILLHYHGITINIENVNDTVTLFNPRVLFKCHYLSPQCPS